jgi:hypothetical protein
MSLNLEDYSSYTIVKIDIMCHQSYPCHHNVNIKLNNLDNIISVIMSGDKIANYYKHNNIIIPQHYIMYVNNKN